MSEVAQEVDYAATLGKQLEILSQGAGIWHEKLPTFMVTSTPDLARYWAIDESIDEKLARDTVRSKLRSHYRQIKPEAGKPWSVENKKDIFTYAFYAGFNIYNKKVEGDLGTRQSYARTKFNKATELIP